MSATKTRNRPPARPSRSTFSDEVRDAITRSGLTPYAVARDSGVDPGVVSRFLNGQRSITTDTLDRIAPALGLHLAAVTRQRGRPRKAGPAAMAEAPAPESGDDGGDDPGDPGDLDANDA